MSYKREMNEEGVRKHELKVGLWDCKRYDFFPYTHMRLLLILQVDSPTQPYPRDFFYVNKLLEEIGWNRLI